MEWIGQVAITLVGSILTYLAATKKSKNELEKEKIRSEAEISKIKEEANKEIEKIKTEAESQIKVKMAEQEIASKSKEEDIKNEAMLPIFNEIMRDPKKAAETLKELQKLSKLFPPKK